MPPNVLLLMSDQHVPAASGAYGSSVVSTPHLDALADRGVTFDAGYANSPICVPSRAALATGRYPHRTGNVDNASPYLGTEAPSWGHRLAEAAVTTVTIGKLHYRHVDDDTGFSDQRLPLHVRNGTGDLFHTLRDRQPPAPQLRGAVLDTRAGESDYTTQDRAVADEAVRWLREEAPRQKSWVAHVSFVTPHYPFTAPQSFLDLYDEDSLPLPTRHEPGEWDRHPAIEFYRRSCGLDEPLTDAETRRALRHYFALVSFMDEQVGRVLAALHDTGQEQETLVLYVSDHGELMGTDGLWFKGTMTEASVRIPFVMAGPGVPVGARRNVPVSLVDVFPTILDVVGLKPEEGMPGASLLGLCGDADTTTRTVFSEYHSANSASGAFMIRHGDWKYVHYVGFPERLFNLAEDPDEHVDLVDHPAYSAPLERCRSRLHDICDPVATDAEIRVIQQRRIEEYGGIEKVLAQPLMTHSPTNSG